MTVDLSTREPFDPDASNPDASDPDASDNPRYREPRNRCQAHKKTGARCKRPAIPGGTVCKHHGGNAPQVRAAAQVRLEKATDRMARELIGMALDYGLDYKRPDVRLAAIKDVLDRGGIKPPDRIEVGVDAKPFEKILMKGVAALTREESRRLREKEQEPIDAEVVEESGQEASQAIEGEEGSAPEAADAGEGRSSVGKSGFQRLTERP